MSEDELDTRLDGAGMPSEAERAASASGRDLDEEKFGAVDAEFGEGGRHAMEGD